MNFARTSMTKNCIVRQKWWRILPFPLPNVNDCSVLWHKVRSFFYLFFNDPK
ncbi:DMT superfamily efflux pump [Aggregatibacter aphrophilus NJ8700]|nr:DMT superfamily efflux pump [Aggregatibacter aphrophilus NJ8700]